MDDIKNELGEKLKKEKETLRGTNNNLNENQKARRAKKHSKHKSQETTVSLNEDILTFLIIQNAMSGVAQANIQEQKVKNAKIAEEILDETNWSLDYSSDDNEIEGPGEVTSYTLSELDKVLIDDEEYQECIGGGGIPEEEPTLLFKMHPGEMTPKDLEQQCPLFQTLAISENVDTNFLGGVQLIPRSSEINDTAAEKNPPSDLDKIFMASGLSSRDFLSDESIQIITIEKEDEE